jgi:hypothetical protein
MEIVSKHEVAKRANGFGATFHGIVGDAFYAFHRILEQWDVEVITLHFSKAVETRRNR